MQRSGELSRATHITAGLKNSKYSHPWSENTRDLVDLPVSHVCLASCELHQLQQTLSQRIADFQQQQQQNTQYFSTMLCDWKEERGRSHG